MMATDDEVKKKDAINKLKKRFEGKVQTELFEDDIFFHRFLKAQNFNIVNAETMLKKHLEWRKKYDIENIFKYEQPEVFRKYLPLIMLGYDKEGSVVRYCPAGNVDWIGLFASVRHEEYVKRFIFDVEQDVEEHRKQSERLGKTVDKCVYIFNLDKLTFAQVTNKRVLLNTIFVFDMYQNNYPERLKTVYAINASVYFSLLFSILKTFLSNSILEKMKIYSDDSYKADLLKIMDADILPGFLGGSKADPDGDPFCPSFINHGGPVPESYYIHKSKRSLAALPDVQKITLTRATFYEVYLEVKEPGSYLEWEFEIKCRDIGFGLFYCEVIDGEEKMNELVPIQRIDTEGYAEHGIYRCEKTGKYVIVFDNTYSWIRAKEIYYKVKVVTPEEQKANLIK